MTKETKSSIEPKEVAPKKPRQKKLSLKAIQAQEAELNKLSTYIVNADDNTVIKYYKKFDQKKIQNLLEEAYEKLMYVEQNDIEFFKTDEEFISYLNFLVISHFTHLGDEIGDTFEEHMAAMNALISLGYYKLILEDILDPNETVGVLQLMNDFIEGASRALDAQNKIQEQTLKAVKSPVIKKKLEANSSHRNVLN